MSVTSAARRRALCPRCSAHLEEGALQCDTCGELFVARPSRLDAARRRSRLRLADIVAVTASRPPSKAPGAPAPASAPAPAAAPRALRMRFSVPAGLLRPHRLTVALATLALAAVVLGLGVLVAPILEEFGSASGPGSRSGAASGAEGGQRTAASSAAGAPGAFSGRTDADEASGAFAPNQEGGEALIGGEIFRRDGFGTGHLSGTRVQLVRTADFRPAMDEVLARMEAALVALRLQELVLARDAAARERTRREALVPAKRTEIEQCVAQRWSEFTYVDPVTDRSSKLTYMTGLTAANPNTLPMMRARLGALEAHVRTLRQKESGLERQVQTQLAALRRALPSVGASAGVAQALAAARFCVQGARTPKDVQAHTCRDLVALLDRFSADSARADSQGHFRFALKPRTEYLVYAATDGFTWLTPVEWLPDNTPRPVILASQNSLNLEKILEDARAGDLQKAFLQLLQGRGVR